MIIYVYIKFLSILLYTSKCIIIITIYYIIYFFYIFNINNVNANVVYNLFI